MGYMKYEIDYEAVVAYLYEHAELREDDDGHFYSDTKEYLRNNMDDIYDRFVTSPDDEEFDEDTMDRLYDDLMAKIDYDDLDKTIMEHIEEKRNPLAAVGMSEKDFM